MLTRMCYCVCGSTGRAARQHVGQLWRWAPASPRCSPGVFQKWWELEFKTNECIKNEVFGCVVRRHLSNSAQSSFRCYYMHWRRKSFCRFLEILHDLCMHVMYVWYIIRPIYQEKWTFGGTCLCCAGDLHMAGSSTRENGLKETITLKWCTPRTNSIGGSRCSVRS